MKSNLNPRELKFTIPIRWENEIESDTSDSSGDERVSKEHDTIILDDSDSFHSIINNSILDSPSPSPSPLPSPSPKAKSGSRLVRNEANDGLFDSSMYEAISDDEDDTDNDMPRNDYKWCICENGSKADSSSKMCVKCQHWYHLNCLPSSHREDPSNLTCPVCSKDDAFIQKYQSKIKIRNSKYNRVVSESDASSTETSSKASNSSDSENIAHRKSPVVIRKPKVPTEEEKRKKINLLKSNTNQMKTITLIDPLATRPKKINKILQMKEKTAAKRFGQSGNRYKIQDNIQKALEQRYNQMDAELKIENKIENIDIEAICCSIVEEIYRQLDPKESHKFIMRLLLNINQINNKTFFLKILTGQIKLEELPKMNSEDMASEERKTQNKDQLEKDIQARIQLSNEWNAEKAKPHFKKNKKGEEYIETNQDLPPISLSDQNFVSTIDGPAFSSTPLDSGTNHSPIVTKNTSSKISALAIPKPILPVNQQLKDHGMPHHSSVSATFMSTEFNPSSRPSSTKNNTTDKINSPVTTDQPANPSKSPNKDLVTNDIQPPQTDTPEYSTNIQPLRPKVNSWPIMLLVRNKKKEYHISTKAHLVPMVNPAEEVNHNIVRQLDNFPREFGFLKQHDFVYTKHPNEFIGSFWSYLSHFHKEKHSNIVFFRFEYGKESNSKQIFYSDNNKSEEEVRTDKGLYLDICEDMSHVYEADVPNALKQHFGELYMFNLTSKKPHSASDNVLEPCKSMREKYSIQITRNQSQICGVLIDAKAIKDEPPRVWRFVKPPQSKRSPERVSPNDVGQSEKNQAVKRTVSVSGNIDEHKEPKKRLDPRLHRIHSEPKGNSSGSETEPYEAVIERDLSKPVEDPRMQKVGEALEKIAKSSDSSLDKDLAKRMLNTSPPEQLAQVINRVVGVDPELIESCLEQELAKEAKKTIAQEAERVAHVMSSYGTAFPVSCFGESREAFLNLIELSKKSKRPFEDYSMENRDWALDSWYKNYKQEPVSENKRFKGCA